MSPMSFVAVVAVVVVAAAAADVVVMMKPEKIMANICIKSRFSLSVSTLGKQLEI